MALLAWSKPLLPPCETQGSPELLVTPHIPSEYSQGMPHAGIKTTYTVYLGVRAVLESFKHLLDSLISGACIPH